VSGEIIEEVKLPFVQCVTESETFCAEGFQFVELGGGLIASNEATYSAIVSWFHFTGARIIYR
jgi:hypothetical protein